MRKLFIALLTASLTTPLVMADVTVEFKTPPAVSSLTVDQIPLSDLMTARKRSEVRVFSDTVSLENGKAHFEIYNGEPVNISVSLPDGSNVSFEMMASAGDNLVLSVTNDGDSYDYTVSGTPLMEGISYLTAASRPYEAKLRAIKNTPGTSPADFERVLREYEKIFTDYIANNPDSPAAAFAMLNLDDEVFLDSYAKLGNGAKASILFPMVEKSKTRMEQSVASHRLQAELENGLRPAPGFTLPDTEGNPRTLADFRGKWLVLDFWGAWCGWCIKGFPALKDAYEKYKGKLEVVGIDCGDTPEAWKTAILRYKLPWVNLYNDTSKDTPDRIDRQYGVQGFPTKIIISPDGQIKKIFTGEDPDFYPFLEKCVTGK